MPKVASALENVFVAGFRVTRKDAPRFLAVGDNVLLSVEPIDDYMAKCSFLTEGLEEETTRMAVRVMVHEEPADQGCDSLHFKNITKIITNS